MDDAHIDRMRQRARAMRRVADMSGNAEITQLLLRAAAEAEADADALEREVHRPVRQLPPLT
jgi:hypothetical protein